MDTRGAGRLMGIVMKDYQLGEPIVLSGEGTFVCGPLPADCTCDATIPGHN